VRNRAARFCARRRPRTARLHTLRRVSDTPADMPGKARRGMVFADASRLYAVGHMWRNAPLQCRNSDIDRP